LINPASLFQNTDTVTALVASIVTALTAAPRVNVVHEGSNPATDFESAACPRHQLDAASDFSHTITAITNRTAGSCVLEVIDLGDLNQGTVEWWLRQFINQLAGGGLGDDTLASCRLLGLLRTKAIDGNLAVAPIPRHRCLL
jgi:hypothetical protein